MWSTISYLTETFKLQMITYHAGWECDRSHHWYHRELKCFFYSNLQPFLYFRNLLYLIMGPFLILHCSWDFLHVNSQPAQKRVLFSQQHLQHYLLGYKISLLLLVEVKQYGLYFLLFKQFHRFTLLLLPGLSFLHHTRMLRSCCIASVLLKHLNFAATKD